MDEPDCLFLEIRFVPAVGGLRIGQILLDDNEIVVVDRHVNHPTTNLNITWIIESLTTFIRDVYSSRPEFYSKTNNKFHIRVKLPRMKTHYRDQAAVQASFKFMSSDAGASCKYGASNYFHVDLDV